MLTYRDICNRWKTFIPNKLYYANFSITEKEGYDINMIIANILLIINQYAIKDIEDDNIEIIIQDDIGLEHKGIIRISDHEVDLQKWATYNFQYDFGISFVIKKTMTEWQGNNIVDATNRNIFISEYVYEIDRNEKDLLNRLIAEILSIRKTKHYISNKIIMSTAPNIIRNRSLSERMYNAIKME